MTHLPLLVFHGPVDSACSISTLSSSNQRIRHSRVKGTDTVKHHGICHNRRVAVNLEKRSQRRTSPLARLTELQSLALSQHCTTPKLAVLVLPVSPYTTVKADKGKIQHSRTNSAYRSKLYTTKISKFCTFRPPPNLPQTNLARYRPTSRFSLVSRPSHELPNW